MMNEFHIQPRRRRSRWRRLSGRLLLLIFCLTTLFHLIRSGARGSARQKRAVPAEQTRFASVALPRWARGAVITSVQVPVGDKSVALTFDDGPSPYTREILRILKDRDVRATFFMVGQQLRLDPQDGLAVRDAGHVIGNHSYTHPAHPHRPRFEVLHTDSLIEEILQVHPQLYRPPYGRLHNGMDRQARQDNKAIILWSVDPQDWRRPAAARLVRIVLRQVRPGAIILLHDGGGDRSETVAALPDIIKTLQQRDYRFVTVPELLNLQRHIPHRVS